MTARKTFKTVAGLNKTLRQLPKEASAKLRDASVTIARMVAGDAAARARSVGGLAAFVAPTIKPTRDRVPKVQMGSNAKLPDAGDGWVHGRAGKRQTVGDVIWGAEFGGGGRATTQQFKPWLGNDTGAGYFLWPAVRQDSDRIDREYSQALREALQQL